VRIGIVAPPWYPLPPQGYGSIETLAHLLARDLSRMGHEVTVMGAEGSVEPVIPLAPAAWRGQQRLAQENLYRSLLYLQRVRRTLQRERLDVVHDHTAYVLSTLLELDARDLPVCVVTMHQRLGPDMEELWRRAGDRLHVVALSAAQAAASGVRVTATIHNGIDLDDLSGLDGPRGDYLVELARICPEKGQHLACELARLSGRRLVLAGPIVDARDERYFRERVEPFLGDQVEHRPNVAGAEKLQLLHGAAAGVFPIQWEEPFGLALVECMAAGTPVLAFRRGAVPELVEEGVTGWSGATLGELASALDRLPGFDRARCAAVARERFGSVRMARDYADLYARLLSEAGPGGADGTAPRP